MTASSPLGQYMLPPVSINDLFAKKVEESQVLLYKWDAFSLIEGANPIFKLVLDKYYEKPHTSFALPVDSL